MAASEAVFLFSFGKVYWHGRVMMLELIN